LELLRDSSVDEEVFDRKVDQDVFEDFWYVKRVVMSCAGGARDLVLKAIWRHLSFGRRSSRRWWR
jgi:hypothetical protein